MRGQVRRAAILVLVAWACLVLATALQAVIPLGWGSRVAMPDLLLLILLYDGLQARDDLAAACALALLLGYLGDLFAAGPKGLHMLGFVIIVLLARLASVRLLLGGALATVIVTTAFAIVFGVVVVGIRAYLDPEIGWRSLAPAAISAAATGLFAPPVFRLLRRMDRRFERDPRILGTLP